MSKVITLALAALLSACATMEPANRQANLQNAAYLAGEGAPQAAATAYPDGSSASEMSDQKMSTQEMTPKAPLRQLYWYFSGR